LRWVSEIRARGGVAPERIVEARLSRLSWMTSPKQWFS
jgi:hypothetical protein